MVLFFIVIALLIYFHVRFYLKVRSLPPGPLPLPFIGNFHQMAWSMLQGNGLVDTLSNWHQKYADVFTFWIGSRPTVHICEYQKAQEAMIKKGTHFANRPYLLLFNIVRAERGLISSSGEHWTEQRRFALHTLKNFGLGKNLMAERVMLELDYQTAILNKEIVDNGGSYSFDPAHLFDLTIGNIINRLLFTDRFTEQKETEFFKLKKVVDKFTENVSPFDFMMSEWNTKVFPMKGRYEMVHSFLTDIVNFIQEQITERKREIDSGMRDLSSGTEDFVDAFLLEMMKTDADTSFNEETLAITLLDLWLAGQETTATTLYWAFSYMLACPETLMIVEKELLSVTGGNRPLTLADKAQTPYLNGIITETLRMSLIVPLNLLREADEDVVVDGYNIPKGTAIAVEISVIMSNPKDFEEPKRFKPERYLGNNLESKVLAFGIGKRACLGEALARTELYLIMGNFLLTYKVSPNAIFPASIEAMNDCGALRRAKPYKMVIKNRI